ncbi:hypothetical protein RJT34_18297 [Clitoria ternatea]|uniref:Uncharacterized protein n=1 Tax=Clitoria ternatea TaxID=43366 RepID=A0AAN9JAJ0_CLITE
MDSLTKNDVLGRHINVVHDHEVILDDNYGLARDVTNTQLNGLSNVMVVGLNCHNVQPVDQNENHGRPLHEHGPMGHMFQSQMVVNVQHVDQSQMGMDQMAIVLKFNFDWVASPASSTVGGLLCVWDKTSF